MKPDDLMFGVVELKPVGANHFLPEGYIGAYCQVLVATSKDDEFRKAAEDYFSAHSLGIGEIEGLRHIRELTEVNADSTLVENVKRGNLQEQGITIGSINSFHSEGEA